MHYQRRGNKENLDNLKENLRKKWCKFIRRFEEVFNKIIKKFSENIKKLRRKF